MSQCLLLFCLIFWQSILRVIICSVLQTDLIWDKPSSLTSFLSLGSSSMFTWCNAALCRCFALTFSAEVQNTTIKIKIQDSGHLYLSMGGFKKKIKEQKTCIDRSQLSNWKTDTQIEKKACCISSVKCLIQSSKCPGAERNNWCFCYLFICLLFSTQLIIIHINSKHRKMRRNRA